jgi:hypothetical protein
MKVFSVFINYDEIKFNEIVSTQLFKHCDGWIRKDLLFEMYYNKTQILFVNDNKTNLLNNNIIKNLLLSNDIIKYTLVQNLLK